MRITGGRAKGIQLKVFGKGEVRPSMDAMREAIFSSLGPMDPDDEFLDLFAGTGAYGLEAFSRGAKGGIFVERNPKVIDVLKGNLERACKSMGSNIDSCKITRGNALREMTFDRNFKLVFADPPYELMRREGMRLIERIRGYLDVGGRLIIEYPGDMGVMEPEGMELLREFGSRKANKPKVCIYRALEKT